MKEFHESMRYEYDLNPDSLVIDGGGYEGDFTAKLKAKYNCNFKVFEPAYVNYRLLLIRFKRDPKVKVFHLGLDGETISSPIRVNGDSTGMFQKEGPSEYCYFWNHISLDSADLIKLNIEGSEFNFLELLLSDEATSKFKNIQVQFHKCVPDAESRYNSINERLQETHDITWTTTNWDGGWTNYRLR